MEKTRIRKTLLNAGKIIISIVLLYFVFTKIPFSEVAALWKNVNVAYLAAAAILFLLSQIVSAKRLELYFTTANFNLSFKSNLELYFLGMFYNFFIPGGIGGDAYKIYLLNKKFGWSSRKLTSSLFNDRLSGLIAICLIICILMFLSLPEFKFHALGLSILGLVAGYYLTTKLFRNFKKIYFKGLGFSLTVQALQIFCFICLLKSIGVENGFVHYSLLFLASSILSLVSFAGIGVREMLFFQAARYFDFNPAYSVSASLLFTVITAFFSLLGLFFQIRTLNLKTTDQL